MTVAPTDLALLAAPALRRGGLRTYFRRHPTIVIGGALLSLMALMAIFAPYLCTVDPQALSPIKRLRWPSAQYWFGTDMLGRDIYSRTIYGARVSLTVGISVALLASGIGLAIGLLTGFSRWTDAIVIFAITVADVPRVTRLVRGVVLTLRELPFVEAAHASGTGFFRILWRHILPNTLPPLLVQDTFVAASAMIVEAILSFLGAGPPPNIPSWGNIMAEGRSLFQVAYYIVLIPGAFLSITVLAINLLGDGLRDALDPRLARRM